jgi:hypothetical protein
MEDPEKDYAHTHDQQAQRTRYELWVIVALVVVVLAVSLTWRAVTGHHPGPQKGWGPTQGALPPGNVGTTPAAGAAVAAHGAGTGP